MIGLSAVTRIGLRDSASLSLASLTLKLAMALSASRRLELASSSRLLSSIELLANVSRLLADKAIASFKVNEAKLKEALSRNPILVTALNPIIGYQKAAEIAKTAYKQGRPVINVALEFTDLPRSQLEALLDPEKLTAGGV